MTRRDERGPGRAATDPPGAGFRGAAGALRRPCRSPFSSAGRAPPWSAPGPSCAEGEPPRASARERLRLDSGT